ncbi:MAG: hypothetical protein CMP86_06575 [Gammaproteobacteria bacterium]|nr:hypothetical protein [Gammaproteobacteria bacterium]
MTSIREPLSDIRQLRGQETRSILMRAAEKLIAEKGSGQVSIREITQSAGQRNSSVLQYHFGNLRGLIDAIVVERGNEVQAKRAEMLDQLLKAGDEPTVRQICEVMFRVSFYLARSRPDYRTYLRAFGHELALSETSAVLKAVRHGQGGESGFEVTQLLHNALPHLSKPTFLQRLDFAIRLNASAISAHARTKAAFRGKQAEFFIDGLTDSTVGLFVAPEPPHLKIVQRKQD